MESMKSEAFAVKEKIKQLEKIPVIKNYYLVLGGGKIGTNFLDYAWKNKLPFVLVIDKDENAPASRKSNIIKTEGELVNLLKNKSSESFHDEAFKSSSKTGENERVKNERRRDERENEDESKGKSNELETI